jgi:hypothetical protein
MDFKKSWTEKAALKVLKHPSVDSEIWAEAVEWLMIHGSQEIRDILLAASGNATTKCFPDLQPESYSKDGQPCYDITALATSLGVEEDEVREILQKKEKDHGVRHSLDTDETYKIQ